MKYFLILLFLSLSVFANYAYKGENSGKIDMHGGKKQNFIEDKQNLSNRSFLLGNIGLKNEIEAEEKNKENKEKTKK